MLAAWAALFAAIFVAAACLASGSLVLQWSRVKLDRFERGPLAFLLGAACVHLAIFAVMALGIATKAVWWILLGVPIAIAMVKRPKQEDSAAPDWKVRAIFGTLAIPFTVLYLVNAWAPETSSDGAGYHLAIVARYLRAKGFVLIPTNMYADLSQGVELLYAPAFAFGKHSAAALVHFAFLIAFGLSIYAFGRRIGRPWAGAAAALMVYVSPVAGRDGTTAYIDAATAAIAFAAFYWLEVWDQQRSTRLLLVIGLMAGYAFAAKYTMFVVLPFALAFIAWRERRIRPLLIASAAAAVMIVPWLAKNWILVHNPVAPFATRIFPSPYFHVAEIEGWTAWLRHYDLPSLWMLPMDVTVHGQFAQGIIGPIFLLAPVGLLALRDRIGRRLLAMGAVLLIPYFQNIGTRFLIPCLPFFALAMMMAIDRWRIAVAGIAVIHAIASWYSVIPSYAFPYLWRIEIFPYRAALRIQPEKDYLSSRIFEYKFLRAMEDITSPRDGIFSLGITSAVSYTSRDVFGPFEGAENGTLFDFLNVARGDGWDPRRVFTLRFPAQQTRRLRVVQTTRATGPDEWHVHEMRFYSGGVEVPRNTAWRLTARPNPWEIQLAFDNSSVTRWRSWQPVEPGMYIQATFPAALRIDEVRMWTSAQYALKMGFEVEVDDGGAWRKVTDQYEESEVKSAAFLGRAATSEMYERGVRYIVMPDSDQSAGDFRDDPEAWGIVPVLHIGELSLYRILPP